MAYLPCKCGKDIFVKAFQLKDTQAGGVVEAVAGWRCFDCGEKVDTLELLKIQDLKRKQQELDNLQKELNEHAERETAKKNQPGNKGGSGNPTAGAPGLPNVRHPI